MADPAFFHKTEPKTLQQIADLAGCEISSTSKANYIVEDVASLDKAGPKDISFLDNVKYKQQFTQTQAGAVIVAHDLKDLAPDECHVLLSSNPYKSYALTAQSFYPIEKPDDTRINPAAIVDPSAQIGKGSIIEAGAVIGPGVRIGVGCKIGANAVISHAIIGDYVNIYRGAMIGQDGFGFAIDPAGFVKVPQLGRVIIEDHVEIGANTTIDRGAGPDTIIGQGTWIDNLVQIGHNVQIGRGCVIVSQVGISGSTKIGDFVMIGGQVGIAGHLHIGSGVKIAAQSGVMRDIPTGEEHMGSPAIPIKQQMRQIATLNKLAKKK